MRGDTDKKTKTKTESEERKKTNKKAIKYKAVERQRIKN